MAAPDGPLPTQGSLASSFVEATYGIDLLGVGMMRVLLNSLSRQATELAWTEHRLGWVDHAFVVTGTPEVRGTYVASLDSPDGHRLIDSVLRTIFMAPDSLLYVSEGTLVAQ